MDDLTLAKSIRTKFELNGFKKAGLGAFDVSATLAIQFAPLKYTIIANDQLPSIEHFYQEPLTKEEIRAIAEKVASPLLEEIKTKTGVKI